jgi:uncharacterized heparinase superfamily protein
MALLLRTMRHLRARQVLFRVVRRLQPKHPPVATPHVRRSDATGALAAAIGAWGDLQPPSRIERADEVLGGRFRFLGHAEDLEPIDWQRRHVSHLWSYNLHYFHYAIDLAIAWRRSQEIRYRARFVALARSWIAATRGAASDGWESYALSERIVSWTYALLLFGDALEEGARSEIESSLRQQLDFLSRRLEWHILANHLQKNLHALVVGSLYFADEGALEIGSRARRLLWHELSEQVLEDGTHYERAPSYHALALSDFLEDVLLLRAAGIDVPASARRRVERMVSALARFTRDDGTLFLFNDSANGVAPDADTIRAVAALVLGESDAAAAASWTLPDAGYYGALRGRANLIVDCGPPGPTYQSGHAHCDMLSFELDLGGVPLIVDAGVHGYDGDRYREYVRSTRAHNTLMIGHREQSEVWSTFRIARRATITRAQVSREDREWQFTGAYRPYHDAGISHARTITLAAEGLIAEDVVSGAIGARVESFLHLHPGVTAVLEGMRVKFSTSSASGTIDISGCDSVSLVRGGSDPVQGWYCPMFGVAEENTAICLTLNENRGEPLGYRIAWSFPAQALQ